jgi:flagellin
MAQYISTNVTSLVAQNNLSKATGSLASNLERLSSGQRINSASDDAAGMAIASRMTAQIKGMEMAKRNTQDAISMTQTAEGAMGVQVEQLQRVRELSVQASNGMLNAGDREKLNNEATSLVAELDKVATETNYTEILF